MDIQHPDVSGTVGRAWRLPFIPKTPDQTASLACWLISGPYHIAWSWWSLYLVSLEDIPGVRPAYKKFPSAEYEIGIFSHNPESPPNFEAITIGEAEFDYLYPPDLVYQFGGITKEQAIGIVGLMVKAIVDGKMSPDSDYRRAWESMLTTTVKHYKSGMH